MLVGQAALAIELWLGVLPPLEPLREAAELALSRPGGPSEEFAPASDPAVS